MKTKFHIGCGVLIATTVVFGCSSKDARQKTVFHALEEMDTLLSDRKYEAFAKKYDSDIVGRVMSSGDSPKTQGLLRGRHVFVKKALSRTVQCVELTNLDRTMLIGSDYAFSFKEDSSGDFLLIGFKSGMIYKAIWDTSVVPVSVPPHVPAQPIVPPTPPPENPLANETKTPSTESAGPKNP